MQQPLLFLLNSAFVIDAVLQFEFIFEEGPGGFQISPLGPSSFPYPP